MANTNEIKKWLTKTGTELKENFVVKLKALARGYKKTR